MKISFDKILIPVDFTVNTRVAIRKALSFNEGTNMAIHLLHVGRKNLSQFELQIAREKLENLRAYALTLRRGVQIIGWITYSKSVEEAIIRKSKAIDADLIVIGKNSHHSWLPFLNKVVPTRIAKESGISVLTVKPGAIDGAVRIVVMPVGDQFPDTKVAAVKALRRGFRVQIRLVAFLPNHNDSISVPVSLLNAYRILRNSPGCQVSYEILYGNNRARAILDYCTRVNADMLIVHPESETNIGWLNKQISDVLPVHSKTQILAINQG